MRRHLLSLVVVLVCVHPVQAADYYVATTGSNAAAGTIGAPWLTVGYALSVPSATSCGDTIYVRTGTYPAVNTSVDNATSCASWGNALTVRPYQSEVVHLPGLYIYTESYLIFQDLILDGAPDGGGGLTIALGSTCAGANGTCGGHIRFVNLDVHGPNTVDCSYELCGSGVINFFKGSAGFNEFIGGSLHDADGVPAGQQYAINTVHGFYISSPSNLIDGVDVYNIDGMAIQVYDEGLAISSNNIIRNNKIRTCGKEATVFAIGVYNGSDNKIYNNVINACKNGINGNGTNLLVVHNTIYGLNRASDPYPAIDLTSGSGHIVQNNILFANVNNTIRTDGTTSPTVNFNLLTDPSFVDAAMDDFHLQTDSDARNAGTPIGSVTTDFDNVARPQGPDYDIGAFEFVESDLPPWPPRSRIRIRSR